MSTGDNCSARLLLPQRPRYALAQQSQLGLPLDTPAAALRTACLTGVAERALTVSSPGEELHLTAGDLDEAVAGLLTNGLVASNVAGATVARWIHPHRSIPPGIQQFPGKLLLNVSGVNLVGLPAYYHAMSRSMRHPRLSEFASPALIIAILSLLLSFATHSRALGLVGVCALGVFGAAVYSRRKPQEDPEPWEWTADLRSGAEGMAPGSIPHLTPFSRPMGTTQRSPAWSPPTRT